MSSCVDSGLDAASRTRAPPARSTRTKTPVSAVTCRQAAMVSPSNGRSALNRARSAASSGIIRVRIADTAVPELGEPGDGPVPARRGAVDSSHGHLPI